MSNLFKPKVSGLTGSLAATKLTSSVKNKSETKKTPMPPKARPVQSDEQSEVFTLLRKKMAYKARMTGHSLEDTRMHFEKCTPKDLKRPGEPPVKLNHELFKIALRRLELELDPKQVDLITSSLDINGTGFIDPTDFFQEAHNFRHHRRTAKLGKLQAPNPKPLSRLHGCRLAVVRSTRTGPKRRPRVLHCWRELQPRSHLSAASAMG